MTSKLLTLEEIAKAHTDEITNKKNSLKRSMNILSNNLVTDVLNYAKNQATADGIKNIERNDYEWQQIYAPYFVKAAEQLFGLGKEYAEKFSVYFQKLWNTKWKLGELAGKKLVSASSDYEPW